MSYKIFLTKFFTYTQTCKTTQKTPKNPKIYIHKRIERKNGVE